ncbi:MAG: hypothetical protein RLZZ584_1495 [Pseudomonadota bacterium]|jgi:GT2 family glycosyltransferase
MSSPAATILFLAYQQRAYVEDALRSVLGQACEPVEIILSDDASTDGTFEAMAAVAHTYRGPHELLVRRNTSNQGIGQHYNTLIACARGQLLVTAAGDDISQPDRVARLLACWRAHGQGVDLITSDLQEISPQGTPGARIDVDDLGAWRTLADWCRRRPHVVGAAHAFTRRLHERFGPYDADLSYEDQVNTLRAILAGGAVRLAEPLVRYRTGGLSATQRLGSAEALRAQARRRNRSHLAVHRQWLADATLAGCAGQITPAIAHDLARELYLASLHPPGPQHALTTGFPPVRPPPFGWRLKKALQHRWPTLSARLRRR